MIYKRLFLCFAFVAACLLLYVLNYLFLRQTRNKTVIQAPISTTPRATREIGTTREEFNSSGYFIKSNKTIQQRPIVYRYVADGNSTLVGKVFQMDNKTSRIVQDFLKEKTFNRKAVTLDAKTPFFDVVVPVTAASSNHFGELMANVKFFPTRFPEKKLFCYDIGLGKSQVSRLKKLPYVTYRKFHFDKYPPHIKNLRNYAWKILIIGELLSEFDGVMWFDTSVRIHGDFNKVMGRLVHFKSGILFFLKIIGGHSIAAATDPGMIEYFPLTPQGKAGLATDMLPGGTILVFNTADVQEHVMKWASICALVKDCIAPLGSTIKCPSDIWTIPREQFANCHRYDQALFSLLVTNLYGNVRERYSLNRTESFADLGFRNL